MLQALYFCKPFREKVLEYKAKNKKGKETLLSCLADLFYSIATQKKKVGTIAPKKFIARLRKEKVDFDNYMQQDAHEFLNFLINHINEIIVGKSKRKLLKMSNFQFQFFKLNEIKWVANPTKIPMRIPTMTIENLPGSAIFSKAFLPVKRVA